MKVLWLASWYPNRQDNSTGDFIQRHAQAVSQYGKVQVIFVKKDTTLPVNTTVTERRVTGNLTELVIYYSPFETGVKIIDRAVSFFNYKKHFRKAVRQYVKDEGKPNYVHVHVAMYAGTVALWIKRKWNIPYFVTEHWVGYYKASVPSLYDKNILFRKLNRQVLKEAALFLPVSRHLGETVKKHVADIAYRQIPNVVNTALFKYVHPDPGKFRFIHISYMNFQKNPEGIFRAAQLLKARGYDFELFMLGNEHEALTALAKKYGLWPGTVIFMDAVPYGEVAGYMQHASALLLFSRFENLPCVLLEALCCGLPVISTRVGGIAEVLHAENGILVENENVAALVDAMQNMIHNYSSYDPEKIAAEASAKFNYAAVGRRIADLYK